MRSLQISSRSSNPTPQTAQLEIGRLLRCWLRVARAAVLLVVTSAVVPAAAAEEAAVPHVTKQHFDRRKSADRRASIPEGYSSWHYQGPCDSTCRSLGRTGSSSSVLLLRKHDLICGKVTQYNGLPGWQSKTPEGFFAGTKINDAFVVRFTDSFAEAGTYGDARLSASGRILTWQSIASPRLGQLDLDFPHTMSTDPFTRKHLLKQCEQFKGDVLKFLSEIK